MKENPTVSVVIPTRGRAALLQRALQSVLSQTYAPHEILIVIDGPDPETTAVTAALAQTQIRVIERPEPSGDAGASARNDGFRKATGELVALLDDDDEWQPNKLESQLAYVQEQNLTGRWACATGVEWRTPSGSFFWPLRNIERNERVGHYLFVRRSAGEGLLAPQTILLPTALARAVPMKVGIKQHADYDWMLRLEEAGTTFHVHLEALTIVHAEEHRPSVSAAANWESSLEWAEDSRLLLGDDAFSGFCLTEVGRRARETKSLNAFARPLRAALSGLPTPFGILRYILIWLLPQKVRWLLSGATQNK